MAFERVARLDEVPEGGIIAVTAGREGIALCRVEGEVYAVSNVCTHDGGALDQGETFGYALECPRHGSRFDLRTGQVVSPPALESIRTFPVRVVDGVIEVDAAS